MTPSNETKGPKLWQLRGWLTVPEAAHYLSSVMLVDVAEADVLRLALDGHLQLSVRFMRYHPAKSTEFGSAPTRRQLQVGGADSVYDLPLPMHSAEREDVERRYQRMTNGPELPVDNCPFYGVTVVVQSKAGEAGTGFELLEETNGAVREAASLPDDATLIVRTAVLQAFTSKSTDKPLTTRERDVLLTIIAALAKEADIDVSQPSKAGGTIASLITQMGRDVAPNTVAGHLRKLRKVLDGTDDPS